jgi:hypothetical protein
MEFLLKNAICNIIGHRNDEAVLLLEKSFMNFSEIAITLALHIESTGIVEPSIHGVVVVVHHHLWQDLLY